MFKKLIFLVIIGGLVYLNVTTPKQAEHEALLLEELQQFGPVSETLEERIFAQLDYSNFLVCSAIKTSEDSKMLSLGYLKKVNLVHTEWAQAAYKKYQKYSDY